MFLVLGGLRHGVCFVTTARLTRLRRAPIACVVFPAANGYGVLDFRCWLLAILADGDYLAHYYFSRKHPLCYRPAGNVPRAEADMV